MTGTASTCPVCGRTTAETLENWTDPIAGQAYRILRCGGCSLAFADPLRFPGGDWYEKYNYLGGTDEDSFAWTAYRVDFLLGRLPKSGGRWLDIGCGAGHIPARAAAAGFTADGMEVDRRLAARARKRTAGDIFETMLDEAFAEAHAGAYDVVSLFDVLEHVEDPKQMVGLIKRLLKADGCLLISVPNDLRPLPRGRDDWDYPPHHLTRWTPQAMAELMLPAGYKFLELSTDIVTVFMFSRHAADASARALLKAYKRLRYGAGAQSKDMDQLTGEAGAAAAPAKAGRVRWVARYHMLFHWLTLPYFGPKALWTRLTRKHCGANLLVLAQKR